MTRNDPPTIQTADTIADRRKGRSGDAARATSASWSTIISAAIWNLMTVNPTDYRLTMKTSEALKLRAGHADAEHEHDREEDQRAGTGGIERAAARRERRPKPELLVQLPGVDDPARVKQILKTAAMLELYEVIGGPFASREEALAEQGRRAAAEQPDSGEPGARRALRRRRTFWSRTPVVTGRDLRDASRSAGQKAGAGRRNFVLTQDAAKRFERFTGANIGKPLAIVLDKNVIERADDSIEDQRYRAHHRCGEPRRRGRSGAESARRIAARRCRVSGRAHGRTVAGRGFDPGRAVWRALPA